MKHLTIVNSGSIGRIRRKPNHYDTVYDTYYLIGTVFFGFSVSDKLGRYILFNASPSIVNAAVVVETP